jgi:HSP20 family protein
MRRFTVPEDCDPSKLEASFRDGMLYLEIPKTERVAPRQIEVKVR